MLRKPLQRLEAEIGDCEARIRLHDTRLRGGLHALRGRATHALGGKAVMGGGALLGTLAGLWWARSQRRRRRSAGHADDHAGYRDGYRDGLHAARRRRHDTADMLQRWSPLLLPLLTPLLNPKVAQTLSRFGVPVTLKPHADLPTVAKLDLVRYAGRWCEIARLPTRHEAACRRDVTAEYVVDGEGGLTAHNRCVRDDGTLDEATGRLRMRDVQHPGELELTFAPPSMRWWPGVWEDYWVLFVDEQYSVSLVGTPDRSGLWILARDPSLPAADLEALKSLALRHGFDTDRLVSTPHGPL